MCGIVGYIGKNNAVDIVLEGIKRLEYRGYDSAGIVGSYNGAEKPFYKKAVGKIASLEKKMGQVPATSIAIAHTRWATHGKPSIANAHPHTGCKKNIFVVHNGIIENHSAIKQALIREGHEFESSTDTEVLAHLIERSMSLGSLDDAVIDALRHVVGTFGILVMDWRNPEHLVAARKGSPLLLGIGNKEYFVASDAAAVVSHTKKVIYLNDNEMVSLTPRGYDIFDFSKNKITKKIDTIDWDIEQAQKSGFDHFMQKEIFEAPSVIRNTIGGRIMARQGLVKLGGLESVESKLRKINRVVMIACGTSYYAALIGKYLFGEYAGLPVEVEYASEFRYNKMPLRRDTVVIAISQSGETADTLEAIKEAKRKKILTLGIVNVVGSTITREVDAGVYNHAGPEVAVASTKAFLSQLIVLSLLSVYLGRMRNLTEDKASEFLGELLSLPKKAETVLKQERRIKRIAERYKETTNFLYLGRRYNWPVALEGALKLKEISYVHAEGYPAGEMKHGPIAIIDSSFPTIVIALRDSVYEKTISNIEEIRARHGEVIAICEEGDKNISRRVNDVVRMPKVSEALSPIISVIPLQLFAYWMAILRGADVDKPRNLAKSVTVE